MKITLPIQIEHTVALVINGASFSIDAGLSMSDVEKIGSSKNPDGNSIIAGIIASKVNEKFCTSFTKEQILAEGDSILQEFLRRVPHLQDFSSVGFQSADELVNQVKDHYSKLTSMIKRKLPTMPDCSKYYMPSPESIKAIGDSLRFEQERKLEEYEAQESTKETASNTAELLAMITEMKSENTESSIKQHRVNVVMLVIGVLTLLATVSFGLISSCQNGKQYSPPVSPAYSNSTDSDSPKEEIDDNNGVYSSEIENISETDDD